MALLAVNVKADGAIGFLKELETKFPQISDNAAREVASFAAQSYMNSAKRAGIRSWRGNFYGNLKRQTIKPTKTGKGSWGVSISSLKRGDTNYFIALDRMPAHRVSLKRGRIITKWALEKGVGTSGKSVFVKPKPFIERAEIEILRNVRKIAIKEVDNQLRRVKK